MKTARAAVGIVVGVLLLLLGPAMGGMPVAGVSGAGQDIVPGDEDWQDAFAPLGTDGSVNDIAVNGDDIYFGGRFASAGGVAANNIVKWAGGRWSPLGSGTNGAVEAIAVCGSDVYVTGLFTEAGGITVNHVAKWDGTRWSALGGGLSREYYPCGMALAVSGSDVYVGGWFSMAGSVPANNIAKWDGTNWSNLGDGTQGRVYALAVVGTDLYVGGGPFLKPDENGMIHDIVKWDGTSWSYPGGTRISGIVWAMAVSGNDLYIGGEIGGSIAKWDGSEWSVPGSGLNSVVRDLAASGGNVYAAGDFNETGDDLVVNHVAKWDGISWSAMDRGLGIHVSAVAVAPVGVLAGGSFEVTDFEHSAQGIARWTGSHWSTAGGGIDLSGEVLSIVAGDKEVYVGGEFFSFSGVDANNIVKWDGADWSALGTGVGASGSGSLLGPPVYRLAVNGADLYVTGWLQQAGGVPIGRVAKWDGDRWSAVGGSYPPVFDIAATGDQIYVGNYTIARWDGTGWSDIGGEVDGGIGAVAASGNDLYIGGNFTTVGGIAARGIAKWDGNAWSKIGDDLFNYVSEIVLSGEAILAGGVITATDGTELHCVAKWDGTGWSVLGTADGRILSMAVNGNEIYVGGAFSSVNGVPANNIARWDGLRWSALGSGTDGSVQALAVSENKVYVGGLFTTAGQKPSYRFGIWSYSPTTATISGTVTLDGLPLPGVVMNGLPSCPVTDARGRYTDTISVGWSGKVSPTLTGKIFTPPCRDYVNVIADQSGQNYSGSPVMLTISGTVTVGDLGIQRVLMDGLPGNVWTDAQGRYSSPVPYGWSGNVVPVLAGYEFTPLVRGYEGLDADRATEAYAAVPTSTGINFAVDKTWGEVPLAIVGIATAGWAPSEGEIGYTWQLWRDGSPAAPPYCCQQAKSYVLDTEGTYVLVVIAWDFSGRSSGAYAVIYAGVNAPPVPDAGPDQSVHAGGTATLNAGASSDPNDSYPLQYAWTIAAKPEGSLAVLSDPTAVNPSFTVDREGTYVIMLELVDSEGLPSITPDSVQISTVNVPPVADAGPDQAVTLVNTRVHMDGTKSYDDDGDPVTYSWTVVSRPANSRMVLSDPTSPTPSFIADVKGDYVLSLTVSDPWVSSDPDEIIVGFSNLRPVADAGVNQSVIVGTPVGLDGSGSSDANLDPLTFGWSMVNRPDGSAAKLLNPDSAYSSFIPDRPGTYIVSLVVHDGTDESDPSNISIVAISQQNAVSQQLIETTDVVNGLDPSLLKNAGMVNALTQKINEVLAMVQNRQYPEALDKLKHDILKKTDGCAETGAPDKNDWITECASQARIYAEVMQAIQLLEDLIGG